jgi:hypothetical protein
MRNPAATVLLGAAVNGVCAFVACGGAVETPAASERVPSPAVETPVPMTCDSVQLTAGAPCIEADNEHKCELGNDVRSGCNVMLTCRGGAWTRTRGPHADECPTESVPKPRPKQNEGCPEQRPRQGTSCSTHASPLSCNYGGCTGAGDDAASIMLCQSGRWTPGCWD